MKITIGRSLLPLRFVHLLVIVFVFAFGCVQLRAQEIAATDGTPNCAICAPTGWSIANGTPDISDRNFAATSGTSNGGTSWTAAPLPLPPNNHTNWISLRDLGPTGVEEVIETNITGLSVGVVYQLTIYTLTAIGPYSTEFNDSFRYQIGSNGLQTINGITENSWGTETIVFVASSATESIQFLPGNNSGGSGAFESVQISITEDAIITIGVDTDLDGVPDNTDICNGFDDNVDTDSDGVPDGCDEDDDNDGLSDAIEENCLPVITDYEAYWPMDNTTLDITANNHDAVSEIISFDTNAKKGSHAASFNGSTEYIQYSNGNFLNDAISEFSYAFWIKPNDLNGIQTLLDEGGSTNGITVRLNDENLENAVRAGGSASQQSNNSFVFPDDNFWHHVAIVFDDGIMTMYLDGRDSGSINVGFTEIPAHSDSHNFGRTSSSDAFGAATGNYYSGLLDEVLYFTRPLNSSEIQNLLIPICNDDLDALANVVDNDSDSDSCFDALEGDGGFTFADIDGNGRLTATVNQNGIPNGSQQSDISSKNGAQQSVACTEDSDFDGVFDEFDLDDDNDGISDVDEGCYGNGTVQAPFNSIYEANLVSQSGRYFFDLGNGVFEADVDVSNGGGWVLVLQYVHSGGSNPDLEIVNTGEDLPILSTSALGTDESGSTSWGHISNTYFTTLSVEEIRWFAQTSNHNRTIHFSSPVGISYAETGNGSFAGIAANNTKLTGHSANLPDSANNQFQDQGDLALTNFPFYQNATAHWGIKGNSNRWEVDDFVNGGDESTIHRVWVRNTTPTTCLNTDGDALPDYLDNDSDNDGCFDALEGDGGYSESDIDSEGKLLAAVDTTGIPGGTLQNDISSTDENQIAQACSDDTDGDGISDEDEILNGTDGNNPCDPAQVAGYTGYDPNNSIWQAADCDNDGVLNGDEFENGTDPYAQSVDTDGDGIDDDNEIENGTDENNPCDPAQVAGYTGFDEDNTVWQGGDCDNDGVLNGDEVENGTDPYATSDDTDGDGIDDDNEIENGTDENNPCDPIQTTGYNGFDSANVIWQAADCDGDGVSNGSEFNNGTDPYLVSEDTDGDGIDDDNEIQNGTDENDPCSPFQDPGYSDFDSNNAIWSAADCDGDGVSNGDEFTNGTDPYEQSDDTDGDGIDDDNEIANNTDRINPCDPQQAAGYSLFVGSNSIWRAADCDNDGILNGTEFDNGTDPYSSSGDTDGDGIDDETEIANGTDEINPCDPAQNSSYTGFDGTNDIWRGADCDEDGVSNGDEFDNGTNPYATSNDTDGDGINDDNEIEDGTSPTDACDPAQQPGYTGFDLNNPIWLADDCDNDGISNGDEISNGTDPYSNPGDTDGDGILDDSELAAGSDVNDPCSPSQPSNYQDFNPNNPIWRAADCDGDGVLNGNEFDNGTNPYAFSTDTDGDGINDDNEIDNGSDINDPCSPAQNPGYANFNDQNPIWANADCDNDSISNGDEFTNGTDPYDGGTDTDGDGIADDVELANGSLPDDPCSPAQSIEYTGFDATNEIWRNADCDNDGVDNGTEADNGTNPYENTGDTDGDGISNDSEINSGFDPNDPCDPEQKVTYEGFNANNEIWRGADCDGDGFLNGEEVDRGTNPYLFTQDSDGDGLFDEIEITQGTDVNNPCDPAQETGYNGFDEQNSVWLLADCDGDGLTNGEEFNNGTDPYTFDESLDPEGDADGDGVSNGQELEDGTDPNDSCDSIGGTPSSEDDCDNDGLTNGEESTGIDDPSTTANPNGITTNPSNEDTDGDGINDGQEALDQTNPNDACDSNGGNPPANVDCSLVSITSDLVSPQTNGRFTIQNIERFPNNNVTIYNRWGVKVYEASNYDNINIVFDGISTAGATLQKTEELPAGVYFYIITYDRNGESSTLNGYLYLNR
ncbi:LamG-like jellyroll fold domain-containing protein [Croceivirga thetidis]|uniref:LamG-like jellyroll fold domain-containing protein n=1 Tax=Croceivirga thetidis TaxID=2721623 RepID=A0ABX1GSI6_9FLAO|nr:LamG-like jellyroll fold domain-containing protein [Croceivirga thetidis]NKI32919.1 hypothetical protein [Croceivirga thetidis]